MESESPAQLPHRCQSTNRLVSFILKIKIIRTETYTHTQTTCLGPAVLFAHLFSLLSDFSAQFSLCHWFKHGLYVSIHCNFDQAIFSKEKLGDFLIKANKKSCFIVVLGLLFSFSIPNHCNS